MEDGKYKVIKSPIDLAECKGDVRSFLGRSEKGVYFAAIDPMDILRVRVLSESSDQTAGWVSRYHSKLNTYSWWLHELKRDELKYNAPWILDVPNEKRSQKEVSLRRDACWNSDDDDDDVTDDSSDDEEEGFGDGYIKFLGFHPYKEVIFLCRAAYAAVAFSLNSSKFQCLGSIHPRDYNRGQRDAFVYTPCLIGDD